MVRTATLGLTIALSLFAGASRGGAQTITHHPNGGAHVGPFRPQAHVAGVTHFSAQPIVPTRFHSQPIYPRTTFWSTDYPSVAVSPGASQAYSLNDLANIGGPIYYPGTDIPFGRPDFEAMLR